MSLSSTELRYTSKNIQSRYAAGYASFQPIFKKLKEPCVAHIRGGGGWWFTVPGLGSRLIVTIKQADEILAILKLLLNIDNFSSGACL